MRSPVVWYHSQSCCLYFVIWSAEEFPRTSIPCQCGYFHV